MDKLSLQVEDGNFTRIVNPLFEELLKIPFKGCELAVALFIIRKTYGFNKKQDGISLTQLCKGLERSRPTIVKALDNLQLVNIALLVKKGDSKGASNIWSINKYYDTWKLVNMRKLVKRKKNLVNTGLPKVVNTGLHTKDSIKDNTTKDTYSAPDEIEDTWPGFQALWAQHPRKENKRLAQSAYYRLMPNPSLRTLILDRHKRWCESEQWARDGGRFVPLLANWLNDRRWEDKINEEQGSKVLDLSKVK